jgi:Protein of unknown function (DUF2934)
VPEDIDMAITTRNTDDITAPSSGESLDGAGADSRAANDNRIEKHSFVKSDSARRHTLIAEAAYRRAEQRGFEPGDDWQDWFAAEREVDTLIEPDL